MEGEHDIERAEVANFFVEKQRDQFHVSCGKETHGFHRADVSAADNAGGERKEPKREIDVGEGEMDEVIKRAEEGR